DRRDVLLGDGAAHDGVDKLVALLGVGLDADLDVAVLALTAGLAGVLVVHIGGAADGLFVGHLGLAHVGLHLEFAQQAVHDDLQVELAHAGDDGLAGLLVGVSLKGGVFLGQLGQ